MYKSIYKLLRLLQPRQQSVLKMGTNDHIGIRNNTVKD